MRRLDGKVAIVTGAATGLGREIARLYAEAGASVVVADVRDGDGREAVASIEREGGVAAYVPTDVSDGASVRAVVAYAEREFGALHVMTANAGILGRGARKPLDEVTEDEIAETMNVNFGGVALSFKYAIPAILRAGGGAMTATSSTAANRGVPRMAAYCASKSAVEGLVRSLAIELAPDIRVNAVAAGSMATPIRAHEAEAKGLEQAPEKHGTDPREVAYAHLFLVSAEASFVNGQALGVDGGQTTRLARD